MEATEKLACENYLSESPPLEGQAKSSDNSGFFCRTLVLRIGSIYWI